MPLYWKTGSARSISYQFVRKTGRVLDVLLDAEMNPRPALSGASLASLRVPGDRVQRQQALTTVGMLQKLGQIELMLEELLITNRPEGPAIGSAAQTASPDLERGVASADNRPSTLFIAAQDVSSELRNMALVQANLIHELVNQQTELLLLADTIALAVLSGVLNSGGGTQIAEAPRMV